MSQDLLTELSRLGIKLRLADGGLDVLAPAGKLTPELREQLRAHREQLIEMLEGADATSPAPHVTPQPGQRHEPFPLTDIQHAYWVGSGTAVELGGVGTHYYFELDGLARDPRRLADSFRRVIDRHDMLRAIVLPDGRQRTLPAVPPFEIPVSQLAGLPPDEREAELGRIRADMGHRVQPAGRWPLLEIRVSLLGDQRMRLHISVNMLIMDAYSLSLMFNDWHRFYTDPAWSPDPLPLSYRDYVLASEAHQQGNRYRRAEEYWRQRLDSLPPAPALPLARQPAQLTGGQHGGARFTGREARLNRATWAALKGSARRRAITPSALLLTAFADIVRRWSGQPAFTLNLTMFDRPPLHPQIGAVIGDFTSLTMLSVETDPQASFAARAARIQQQLMRDLEHSSYSGVRVLRERSRRLGSGPEASMPVVFTSALAVDGEEGTDTGRGFFGRFRHSISQTPQVWLDHQVGEDQGELLLNWDAVEELFPDGLLDDMLTAYLSLLGRLASTERAWDETGPLTGLPAWQAAERDQANDTAADLPAATLCGLAEATAARSPDAVAVIAADGQLSYREVTRDARRLARRLAALGAGRGDLVGVVLDKGRAQVPAVLGICSSGAAYLPVDPEWPPARRQQVLEQGGVRIVVTSPERRDELSWPSGLRLVTFGDAELGQESAAPLAAGPDPSDLAYVIFTSGSTGQPKGVMIDHRGAANTIQDINQRFGVGSADRVLALSSLTFDLSVYDIFGILAAGGAVVIPAPGDSLDPARWTELLARHEVTIWNSVPALMQAWTENGQPLGTPVPGLRLVMLSGDSIPVSLPDRVRGLQPGAEIVSLGGATEASIWSVWYPVSKVSADWTRIPYGKPLAQQTLHVYDDQLQPVPVWTAGELYIGGTGVAQGYWRDPEKTAQRFLVHPVTAERIYRTGDVARYLPGGNIDFLGRTDFQVKLNGYRIELDEIAAALRGCPGVRDALADVAVHPVTGRRQLIAYVLPEPSAAGPARADGAGEAGSGWLGLTETAAAEIGDGAAELAAELSLFEAWWQIWEAVCPPLMARTLARLGVFTTAGGTAAAAEIVRRYGVKPQYEGLLSQWLAVLAAEGLLRYDEPSGRYRCDKGFDAERLDRDIRQRLATELEPVLARTGPASAHRAFAGYLHDCAEHQLELLRGQVSPLHLLLPDGSARVTDALYDGNPVSRLLNQVVARLVRTIAERGAPGRPVQVLEIGGGTGGTTARVLKTLPADRARYLFTDVSTYFTRQAERDFAGYPFVSYGLYDIDREPGPQAIAPGSADVVVAANVLHDARDLAWSLRQLHRILAPGGVLIAIEGTANSRIQMVSVGFIEGFSHHQDDRAMPLLPVDAWRDQLAAAGFARFASCPAGAPVAQAMVQHVLLGERSPDDAAQRPGDVSPVIDPVTLRETLEQALPGYMVPQHYLVISEWPLNANGKVDRSALPTPWSGPVVPRRTEPRDRAEQTLLQIWREVLGREDIGVADNFFELGGDSLHAVRIFGRVREELGMEQSADEAMQALFECPTVAGFATVLNSRQAPS